METYHSLEAPFDVHRFDPPHPKIRHGNRPPGGNRRPGLRICPAVEGEEYCSSLPSRLGAFHSLVPSTRPDAPSSLTGNRGTLYLRSRHHTQAHHAHPAHFGDLPSSPDRRNGIANKSGEDPSRAGGYSAHKRDSASRKIAGPGAGTQADGRPIAGWFAWHQGSSAIVDWFFRSIQAVGACGTGSRCRGNHQRRAGGHDPAIQDRSGRRGPEDWCAIWQYPGNVPSSCV